MVSKAAVVLVAVTLLGGCSAAKVTSATQDAYRSSLEVKYVSGVLPPEAYSDAAVRNSTINDLVFLVDNTFQTYVESLYTSGALFDTVTDLAILGTSTVATVAGGEGAKAVMSAAIAAISGTRATVDKNYFAEQSRLALISKMREMRARELIPIEQGKQQDISTYPMSQAMVDLQNYFYAGDLLSALQDITSDAAAGLVQQQQALHAVKMQMQR